MPLKEDVVDVMEDCYRRYKHTPKMGEIFCLLVAVLYLKRDFMHELMHTPYNMKCSVLVILYVYSMPNMTLCSAILLIHSFFNDIVSYYCSNILVLTFVY